MSTDPLAMGLLVDRVIMLWRMQHPTTRVEDPVELRRLATELVLAEFRGHPRELWGQTDDASD